MKIIALGVLASALMASSAGAAPLAPAAIAPTEVVGIEQVRLVCNQYGRCYQARGPRYAHRYYGGDGYGARRSYGYYGRPSYDRGYGYYGGGPSIGFSFGSRNW
jgi:hypothetical protein